MPGLRYLGPTLTTTTTTTTTHGNHPLFQDVYTAAFTDFTWDLVDLNPVQLPAVEALPLVPTKHKACRPHQLLRAAWIKGKDGSASGLFSSKPRPMSPTAPAAPCHGGIDTDDLAAMVHDFIESGSPDYFDASDTETGPPSIAKLCETLQVLTSSYGGKEKDLLHEVQKLVLEINVETDLICYMEGSECKGGCTKRLVVKHLRAAGYDAAVCKSKWESSGRVLRGAIHGGEYEYIDVEVNGDQFPERLILDIDFQDQFVLARATPHYLAALQLLPSVFVGTTKRLEQVLEIMSEAAKVSLKQNSMPLPPWRTLDYMTSKWLSPHERTLDDLFLSHHKGPCSLNWKAKSFPHSSTPESRQWNVQLRRTKESLLAEVKGSKLNALARGGRPRPHPTSRVKRSGIL